MEPFDTIISDLKAFNENAYDYVEEEIIDNESTIISMNVNRIFNEGTTTENIAIKHKFKPYRIYSPKYEAKKKRFDLYRGHIDLSFEGTYLDSYTLNIKDGVVNIQGNANVDGFDLDQHFRSIYGKIDGLTEEQWETVNNNFIEPRIIEEILKIW